MADNIDKLFESIESDILNEDIKLQLGILYEQSLNEAVKAKEAEMEKNTIKELNEFKKHLTEQTDKFLDFFVEDFTKKNTPSITNSVKVKLAERIIKSFNTLLEDFQVSISDKTIVNDDALAEAKKEVNYLTKQLMEARKESKLHKKVAIIVEHACKLETEVQKSNLAEYAKDVPFDKMFESKIKNYVTLQLSESKAFVKAPIVEKINEVEKNEKPIIFEQTKSAVDGYVDSL